VGKLLFLLGMVACTQDYSVITGETKTIVVTEIETVTETETVEVEVEVPVYVEVEVPTNEGEIWIDSFTQPMSVDGIDILWVIDRSGSMRMHDASLLAGVEAMLLALPESDWRLVMINADSSHSVTNSLFPLVPGDDAEDAADMLNSLSTAHREEGFNATYEYIVNNPYSSTWMRPDAGLLVVFVSDEEEQSDFEYPTASDFVTWYSSMRMGSVFMASIVNVEASESMCIWPPSPLDIGSRYMDATNMLGGTIVDICDDDWSPGVTDATHSIEPYENIELTHKAEIDSIRVFVNGSLNHDWLFIESENTVYFTIIPSAGELVEVGYRYIEPDTGP
tara:strand:- start:2658 stop:3662 length:1005 start_codon:yes stop_codon:yes gene_type:complete